MGPRQICPSYSIMTAPLPPRAENPGLCDTTIIADGGGFSMPVREEQPAKKRGTLTLLCDRFC